MSVENIFGARQPSDWGLDTIAAVAVVVVAALLFPLRFFVSAVFVQAIPLVAGAAGVLYLATKRYGAAERRSNRWEVAPSTVHVLRMTTVVAVAATVFAATLTGGRTVPFFAVATLAGTLVLAQVLFAPRAELRPGLVLAQVLALAVVVRAAALATTPGFVGVDAWVHVPDYAASVRSSGDLSAIADSKYYSAPLYHLLVVVASEAFGSSLRTGLYWTLGLVMPVSVLLVYLSTREFLAARWALLATAAFAVADHVVRWGIHVIPTSMGLVFFLAAFYGVSKLHAAERTRSLYAFVLLAVVATVLTHQISTFVLLVFLGAGTLAQLTVALHTRGGNSPARTGDNHVNFAGLLLVALPVALVDWSLAPARGEESFLEGMLGIAGTRLAESRFLGLDSAGTVQSSAVRELATTVPTSVSVLDSLGFFTLLLVALVGSLALLGRDRVDQLTLTWLIAVGVMALVTLGAPLFGVYFLIPLRWYAFMYVPMVVLGAYGLRYLDFSLSARQFVAVAVVFALCFTGPMLVNHKATPDNPVRDDAYQQFAYGESELAAADTIGSFHAAETTLYADDPYFLLLRDWQLLTARPVELTDGGDIVHETVVYRDTAGDGITQARYGEEMVNVPLSEARVCRPSMSVLYTNGEVQYCRATR